jgi:hypothetical protein
VSQILTLELGHIPGGQVTHVCDDLTVDETDITVCLERCVRDILQREAGTPSVSPRFCQATGDGGIASIMFVASASQGQVQSHLSIRMLLREHAELSFYDIFAIY